MSPRLIAAALSACLAVPVQAQSINDCPLDLVRWVDETTGHSFRADFVRRMAWGFCNGRWTREEFLNDECSRPSYLYQLSGTQFDENGEAMLNVGAIWQVIPAAPCCSWTYGLAEDIGATIAFLPGQSREGQAIDQLWPYHRRNMATLAEIGAPATIPADARIGLTGSFGGDWTAAICEPG